MVIQQGTTYKFWGYNYEYTIESLGPQLGYRLYNVDTEETVQEGFITGLGSLVITLTAEGRYTITIWYPEGSGTGSKVYDIRCYPELKSDIITTLQDAICGCTSLTSSKFTNCIKGTDSIVASDLYDMQMLYNSVNLYVDLLTSPNFIRFFQCPWMSILAENFYTLHRLIDELYQTVTVNGYTPCSARLVKLYTAYAYVLFYIMELDMASCTVDSGSGGTLPEPPPGPDSPVAGGAECEAHTDYVVELFDYTKMKLCFIDLGLDFKEIFDTLYVSYMSKDLGVCEVTSESNPSYATIDNLTYQNWTQYVEIGAVVSPLIFSWDITGTPEDLVLNDKGFGTIVDQAVTGTTYNTASTYTMATKGSVQWELRGSNVNTITLQTNWMYPSYWGKNVTGVFPIEAEVLAGTKMLGDFTSEIEFQPDTAITEYAWIAVSVSEAVQYTNWEVQTTILNSSVIGTGASHSQFIGLIPAGYLDVSGTRYYVYMFSYPSEVSEVIRLFKP